MSLLLINIAVAQSPCKHSKIHVVARPLKDSILLRWGPDNSLAWQSLNHSGYKISRYTVVRDGEVLLEPELSVLTPHALTPMPLNSWENWIDSNQYAAIAAQAIYGEDFKINQENRSDIAQMVNKIKENESRFSFALFSADQSFSVAKAMALAWVDKTARANEKYLYKIYPALPQAEMEIDTGFVYTGISDYQPLPKPIQVEAKAESRGIMLSWNQEAFSEIYTTYQIERSVDGGSSFETISNASLVNTSIDEKEISRRAFALDTVSIINKRIVYRIKGLSPFGETGPPSDTVSITVHAPFTAVASINKAVANNEKQVIISWSIEENKELTGFDIERSGNPETGFKKLNLKVLSPSVKIYTDNTPANANYYRIKAYGKAGNTTISMPVLVLLEDSIPPAAPQLIKGEVTKEGLVNLNWQKNAETDLFGYRVYRSNTEQGDYVQITRKATTVAFYTDTIELKTLAKTLFYKIVAVDNHFNPSEFSAVLRLERPDILPPSSPSFTKVIGKTTGIYLEWNSSSSEDVVKQELLRKSSAIPKWEVIKSFGDTDTSNNFLDITADTKTSYQYCIRAIDKANLFSDSQPFSAKRIDLGLKPAIGSLKTLIDRDKMEILLSWKYTEPGVRNYLLYKAEEGKPLRLIKTIDGKEKEFTDTDLYVNTIYHYQLKALFTDGSESSFTSLIRVNY
ncbi:fibronectin type III domain-containing protein [Rubrolithibacter danxiaensis]|uniref:fibronectin type III domain-containing protein n=1 Tax=Rubrolithibacter danxiaensis TaxID=3390805 RepID=UPI003BF8D707